MLRHDHVHQTHAIQMLLATTMGISLQSATPVLAITLTVLHAVQNVSLIRIVDSIRHV